MKVYDCLVIGGGPAGLTAAIYLARYRRSVLVIDQKQGRSTYPQINENYLGFPEGIHAKRLRELGKKQAERFGVEFIVGKVEECKKETEGFLATTAKQKFLAKTIILATGVVDIFPKIDGIEEYIGKSLFWCITCDGYKTIGKKVVVVGSTDEAITTCLQFLNFTSGLVVMLNCGFKECHISQKKKNDLKRHAIPLIEGELESIIGNNGMVKSVTTKDGITISTDLIFNQQGAIPNTTLTKDLGVKCDEKGYILCDEEQRTNVSFVYAAGDVTKIFSHQIVTASHEGATAGQSANYDLYEPEQKEE